MANRVLLEGQDPAEAVSEAAEDEQKIIDDAQ